MRVRPYGLCWSNWVQFDKCTESDSGKNFYSDNQFLCCKSNQRQAGFQQCAQLGSDRCNRHCDDAGNIQLDIGERFHECESDGDNDLYINGYQYGRLGYLHGEGGYSIVGRGVDDNDHDMPGRDARCALCRLHDNCQRWYSALYLCNLHG